MSRPPSGAGREQDTLVRDGSPRARRIGVLGGPPTPRISAPSTSYQAGSGPTRTTILPVLSPLKSPRNAVTARSRPSTIVSSYLIRPALTHAPTSPRNSG